MMEVQMPKIKNNENAGIQKYKNAKMKLGPEWATTAAAAARRTDDQREAARRTRGRAGLEPLDLAGKEGLASRGGVLVQDVPPIEYEAWPLSFPPPSPGGGAQQEQRA